MTGARRKRACATAGGSGDAGLAIFTIVSRNYISYAATLMQTVAQHHPNAARYVFLADEACDFAGLDLPARVVTADSIGIADFAGMAFRYSVIELNTAIKPFCLRWLFAAAGHVSAIYLDPDIFVLRPLSAVVELLDQGAPLVLTPHITRGLRDGKEPDDHALMKSGIYNLGFAAFARGAEVGAFLAWWSERLVRHCRVDIADNLFTDQRWMDFAPAFVPGAAILRHPGYNLAYWNLAHRPVTRDRRGGWLAAGENLHFVHFSGVNPLDPEQFSKHQNRFSLATIGGLRPLFETYVAALLANGYREHVGAPYAYARFADGRKIHWLMRNCFRRLEDAGAPPVGATQHGRSQFYDMPEPALSRPDLPDLTRLMHQLWLERRDLQSAFPLDGAAGRLAYCRWFVERAAAEEAVDEASVAAAAALAGRRHAAKPRAQRPGPGRAAPWGIEQPWGGPAREAAAHLRGRVRFSVAGATATLPRQMALLWQRRADLQQAFALATAGEVDDYLAWCLTEGMASGVVAADLLDGALWEELAQPTALSGVYDELPITRGLWLVHARSGRPDAIARFPGDRRARAELVLWFALDAPRQFGWPAALTEPVRRCLAEPLAALAAAGVKLPRLALLLWETREDLRGAFDPTSEDGRLNLLRWLLFIGLDEYGLAAADLPDYLRAALAAAPADAARDLPLLHRLVLLQRDDVRAAFDTAAPNGRERYYEWFESHGKAELARYNFLARGKPAAEIGETRAVRRRGADGPGILLTGALDDPSGRGEDVRMTIRALAAHRVPFMTLDRRTGRVRDAAGRTLAAGALEAAAINIVHLNADTAFEDYQFLRRCGAGEARTVGYWAWELARLPAEHLASFSFYDEIWASTRFAFGAFDTGHRPVSLMPMPVELPDGEAEFDRAHFRLPRQRFLFLFNFDFGSFRARKNPEAAIAAFRQAFPRGNEPVGLVIKTINAEAHTEEWDRLRAAAQDDRRVVMRNGRYTRGEMLSLMRLCDCYVSLHRSEGFGRGPAEAMLLGRPVIATDYSGNADFMTADNSFPVRYELVPVGPDEYPGAAGQVWADADIGHAAEQMRYVYGDPAAAARIGERARRDLRAHYSAAKIGAGYVKWLQDAGVIARTTRRVRAARPLPAAAAVAAD